MEGRNRFQKELLKTKKYPLWNKKETGSASEQMRPWWRQVQDFRIVTDCPKESRANANLNKSFRLCETRAARLNSMPLDSSGEAGKERTAFRQPWRFPGIWWHGGGAGKFQRGSGGQDPCWRPAAMTLLSPAGPGTRLGKFQRRCCRAQGSLSGKIQERVSICPRSKVMATHPPPFYPRGTSKPTAWRWERFCQPSQQSSPRPWNACFHLCCWWK